MSYERVFIWTCDTCDEEEPTIVHKKGYGLPKGWTWIPGGLSNPVTHRCDVQQD